MIPQRPGSLPHGCSITDEIEKIMAFLLKEKGIHSIVKLNPTLLGPERVRYLMGNDLGYDDVDLRSEVRSDSPKSKRNNDEDDEHPHDP